MRFFGVSKGSHSPWIFTVGPLDLRGKLRAGRVKEESGAEARMLGFWSILVLSIFAGLSCCFFSWTLIYLNSYKPGTVPPTLLTLLCRDKNNKDLLLDYGVAVLNGSMATLAVIWNLI
ncbi:ADP-ribosylation factor-like protein 6-interacting protein 6 isoform X2 [Corythoichthys intestinalis]|uniref:ADP-ribosylation factor-like protein 6-interacting protein 6 isoform X2 n=1 Tax=Corythoichthys intestinalis TaxID=161448 RepID=UPI0025A64D4B|nr:ADP-ribosylation factor-like protein 6-interacting protein 6 isoform X2 [Corythoichthys intestinalis]